MNKIKLEKFLNLYDGFGGDILLYCKDKSKLQEFPFECPICIFLTHYEEYFDLKVVSFDFYGCTLEVWCE